ncbi:MAG: hypothetical protein ABI345_10900 [Jatrophihabitans sp.]
MSRGNAVLRAGLVGAATGSRSMSMLAACALSDASTGDALDRRLHTGWGRRAAVAAAAGELVGDKLPRTPPRTDPPGLTARLVLSALTARTLARRGGDAEAPAVLIAVTASVVTTYFGPRVRSAAATRFGSDLPGAVVEDVAALSVAAASTRLR